MLEKDDRISSYSFLGHDQGTIISLLAVFKTNATSYISLAGSAFPI